MKCQCQACLENKLLFLKFYWLKNITEVHRYFVALTLRVWATADYLNSSFEMIADRTFQQNKKEEHGMSNDPKEDIPIHSLQLYSTTEEKVKNIIDRMKPKTSAWEDEISEYCKNELIPPLTNLTNKFLNEGIFPNTYKTAKVYQ